MIKTRTRSLYSELKYAPKGYKRWFFRAMQKHRLYNGYDYVVAKNGEREKDMEFLVTPRTYSLLVQDAREDKNRCIARAAKR